MAGAIANNGRVSLVEEDPDLLRGVDAASAESIKQAVAVPVIKVSTGPWSRSSNPPRPIYGMLCSTACCRGAS